MKKKRQKKKQKIEFKKLAFAIILILCFIFITWSYLLASFGDYEVNEGIATALIYTVIGTYASYALASYGEKNSRNKYNIDESGNKRPERGEKGDD